MICYCGEFYKYIPKDRDRCLTCGINLEFWTQAIKYPSYHDRPPNTLRQSDLATLLGETHRQIHTWIERRLKNKFPIPVGYYRRGSRWGELYSFSEVTAWKAAYEPTPPGRPQSNNAKPSRRYQIWLTEEQIRGILSVLNHDDLYTDVETIVVLSERLKECNT